MTRRAVSESVGTIKVLNGELHIYNDHELIAVAVLTDPQRKQLIAELIDELRYPPC
jgi:hypothetical protein